MSLNIWSDSSAALGICKRRGLGKVIHLAVSDMWVQDRLAAGGRGGTALDAQRQRAQERRGAMQAVRVGKSRE